MMIDLANCTHRHNFRGALFSNPAAYMEFAPERRQYEAAIQTFAEAASPAAIRASIAAARRYGFRLTRADAREAAADGLRESLLTLGYGEAEIRWHAARLGRRDNSLFVLDVHTAAARSDQVRKRKTH
ncbi:hypothetical protein [Bradyrhizobium zhanjiangense]|uniref:Uncharacterized protein n=1 Tax=Bradyrhizobium zhanjiangense TaxID=1325107 RepID=A0A4Q0SQZ9_9BRAD|nr:hypothetical protein [Bradyrhizobium zhanjiangense]RXH41310.1 hypothetical protein XH94_08995 [Bradyrhizobium zhanjiangense]